LPAAQIASVTAFIASDLEARAEYDALRPVANMVGLTAEEPVDSARSIRMKERLMATVMADARASKVTPIGAARSARGSRGLVLGSGLVAAAAVVFALYSSISNVGLKTDLASANARTKLLQTQVANVRILDHVMITDLVAADAQRYSVPEGSVVKRGTHVYFTLRSLPALPKGKVYQAWTLAKGAKTVAPSVTFVPQGGEAVVALPESAANLVAVALSVEPEGGSKAPTSKPTFIRPLS